MRYAKANNEKIQDYDPTKSKSWIVYQECNNLYGWAISQHMPYGDFKWVESKLDELDSLSPTSDIGRVYEVDMLFPNELHDLHKDLPFLPKNKIPLGSKVKKLMATLHSKKKLRNPLSKPAASHSKWINFRKSTQSFRVQIFGLTCKIH